MERFSARGTGPRASSLSSAIPVEEVHALLAAARTGQGDRVGSTASWSGGTSARNGREGRAPSPCLGGLLNAGEEEALLRQRWSSDSGAHLVQPVVPEAVAVDGRRDPIGRRASGARRLARAPGAGSPGGPDAGRGPYELASCPQPPTDVGEEPYVDNTLGCSEGPETGAEIQVDEKKPETRKPCAILFDPAAEAHRLCPGNRRNHLQRRGAAVFENSTACTFDGVLAIDCVQVSLLRRRVLRGGRNKESSRKVVPVVLSSNPVKHSIGRLCTWPVLV